MNSPFAVYQTEAQPQPPARFGVKTPLLLFLACLVLGLGAVMWRTDHQVKAAKVQARDAAAARTADMNAELTSQLLSTTKLLGTLAGQYSGTIPNFQRVATDLLKTRTGLASLELQPGGIVSDIAPRAGHERALGMDVLKDPVLGPGAVAAQQTRALTLSGPVRLYGKEWGFIARLPVFQPGRDGRETVTFVTASMPLNNVLNAAGLNELAVRGYAYNLYLPTSGGQKAITLAGLGKVELAKCVQQTLHVENLAFSLALQPRAGWWDKTKVGCEIAGVLLFATLLAVLANLAESRSAVEAALAEANRRADRESTERKKAVEQEQQAKSESAAAQAEVHQIRSILNQADSVKAELQERLEEANRSASEANRALQGRIQQAESQAAELQKQLEAALHVTDELAQATEEKLGKAEATIKQLQEALAEAQLRLDAAVSAHEKFVTEAQARQEQGQAAIARLQSQLEADARAAEKAAEASAAKLKKAEEANQDLKERLKLAKQEAEGQIAELIVLLEKAHAAAQAQPEPAPTAAVFEEPEESSVAEVPMEEVPVEEVPVEEVPVEEDPVDEAPVEEVVLIEEQPETGSSEEEPPAEEVVAIEEQPEVPPAESVTEIVPTPIVAAEAVSAVTTAVLEEPLPVETPAAPAPLPVEPVNQAVEASEEATEKSTRSKPSKEPKRKRSRRDSQMDLFGGASPEPANEPGTTKPEEPAAPAAEDAPPSADSEPLPATAGAAVAVVETAPAEALPEGPNEAKPAPARRLPPAPPVHLPELRKAVNVILPLLMDQDPGARDCLKDNRNTFRSAFTPEGYVEFEQLVKSSEFAPALEHLKKAARKHGVSV